MKKLFVLISIFFLGLCLFAEESSEQSETAEKSFYTHVIPQFGFQSLQLEEDAFILSPSVNVQFLGIINPNVSSALLNSIILGAGYSMDYYTKAPVPGSSNRFHGANIMVSTGFGKNSVTAMVSSNGEIPFSSIESVIGTLLYNRPLVKTESFSFVLGGGIVAGDFGIKIEGVPIYWFALPMFSFSYTGQIFSGSLALMGLPSVQLTLFPKAIVQLKGSCGLAGFSSARDITFDSALVYYPMKNTDAGEVFSVSAGVCNKSTGTMLKDKTKIKYQYYSVYGEISATLLSIRCGYNFDGKTYVNDEVTGDLYKGIFASLQAMYMF